MQDSRAEGLSRRATVYAVMASTAGWAFDLFDLFILLYVASTVGDVIFPAGSETLSLAAVYASFAVSVLLRPAGAAIFGTVADRSGRKKTLVIVLAGLGLSTAAMGAVPTYAAAGLVAPLLFLTLRLLQGVFVGGVVAATHTLGTESVPPRWRGLMSGIIGGGGAGLGAAMASGLFLLVSQIFPGDQFDQWGWRVMFFTGLVGSALSYLLLRRAEESPLWTQARQAGPPAVVRASDLVRDGRGGMFALNVMLVAGAGTQYYLTSGYLPTLINKITAVPTGPRGMILLVTSLIAIFGAVLTGGLSQRYGRRRTMLTVGCVNLAALPLLTWLIKGSDPGSTAAILLYATLLTFLAAAAYGPVMVYLNERYPTALRARGTALSWNLGFMIGGLMPTFVSLTSPGLSDVPSRLVAFLAVMVLVYIAANAISPETRGRMDRVPADAAPAEAAAVDAMTDEPVRTKAEAR
ncbi:MAG TPA: MFS transporter [Micromonosporaceae bacterium]|nr:MFS transporter [Micromonosporaceae bacterium]